MCPCIMYRLIHLVNSVGKAVLSLQRPQMAHLIPPPSSLQETDLVQIKQRDLFSKMPKSKTAEAFGSPLFVSNFVYYYK